MWRLKKKRLIHRLLCVVTSTGWSVGIIWKECGYQSCHRKTQLEWNHTGGLRVSEEQVSRISCMVCAGTACLHRWRCGTWSNPSEQGELQVWSSKHTRGNVRCEMAQTEPGYCQSRVHRWGCCTCFRCPGTAGLKPVGGLTRMTLVSAAHDQSFLSPAFLPLLPAAAPPPCSAASCRSRCPPAPQRQLFVQTPHGRPACPLPWCSSLRQKQTHMQL